MLEDSLGLELCAGVFGELKTAEFVPQLPISFDRPLNPRRVVTVGSPVAQYNGSLLRLQDGDSVETRPVLRYLEGQTVEIYFTAAFAGTFAPGTDETYIGLFDGSDGVFLGYRGDQFVVGYRNIYVDGGTAPDVVREVTPPEQPEAIHRYRIRYGYLGVGNIIFEYKIRREWRVLHMFETDGTLVGRTHTGSTIVPLRAQCAHAGGELLSGSWVAGTYGPSARSNEAPFFSDGERDVPGNTTAQPLVAFRSKTTFGTRPNKIRSQLVLSEFGTGSEGMYAFEFYQFPAGTLTSGAWSGVNAASVMEENGSFTEAAALGEKVLSFLIGVPSQGSNAARVVADYQRFGIVAAPGDEFGIYKRELIAGAGDDMTAWSISYVDLF